MAAILAHELAHAAVGNENHHNGVFRKCATGLGLIGPMKATRPGPAFEAIWKEIAAGVGPYPHAALGSAMGLSSQPPKQGTRMVKVECPDCGYTVRTTRKWIDIGIPTCPNPACDAPEMEVK